MSSCNNSIGVDISANQIDYANGNYSDSGKFYLLNDIDLNKYSGKFDIVTVLGLIEFLKDDEIRELIKILNKTLKKNGKIILTAKFKQHGNFEKIQNYFGSIDYSKQHINRFDKKKLRLTFSDLSNYEFSFKSFKYFNFFL